MSFYAIQAAIAKAIIYIVKMEFPVLLAVPDQVLVKVVQPISIVANPLVVTSNAVIVAPAKVLDYIVVLVPAVFNVQEAVPVMIQIWLL